MADTINGAGPDPDGAADLADFIELLGQLRIWAGAPSHRTLAKRVGPLLRPPQQISQSTIADTFQTRRRRLNLDLVVAIVRALGLAEPEVARWRAACVAVHAAAKAGGPAGVFRQLPAGLATFTGRSAELARLVDDAAALTAASPSAPVVSTIDGMAGIGKTALAVHAAHRLVQGGLFADVQLYVNLRGFDVSQPPTDPAAVLDLFLRQLGVAGSQIPHDLDARSAMFRARTHDRNVLVLLDNAWNEEQVRPSSRTALPVWSWSQAAPAWQAWTRR